LGIFFWQAFKQRQFAGWPFIQNGVSRPQGWPSIRAWLYKGALAVRFGGGERVHHLRDYPRNANFLRRTSIFFKYLPILPSCYNTAIMHSKSRLSPTIRSTFSLGGIGSKESVACHQEPPSPLRTPTQPSTPRSPAEPRAPQPFTCVRPPHSRGTG